MTTTAQPRQTFAERFPKWNPRYVAYALSHGATDILAFREAQPNNAEFIAWISARRAEFAAANGIRGYWSRQDERGFDRWLEERLKAPEHVAPIVDRVVADILSSQRSGATQETR